MKSFLYLFTLLLTLSGCMQREVFVPTLADVLAENPQLKSVLDTYRDDSLKYEAAVFLIKNLPFHATYDAPSMDAQLKLYELHATGVYTPEQVIEHTAGWKRQR